MVAEDGERGSSSEVRWKTVPCKWCTFLKHKNSSEFLMR